MCDALAILLLLAGCKEQQDTSLARVQQAGVLRVGMDPSWPPFELVDSATGQVVGFDIDLARAIARRLGVEAAFVPSGWEGLYDALGAGHFDAAISALPYDPWRTEEAAYSTSYFNAGTVIVVHAGDMAGNRPGVARPRDLAGRTVHVELGSEGDVQARRLRSTVSNLSVVTHESAQAALTALLADPEGAAVVDAVSARLFIRDGAPLRIAGQPLYDELYVVAVHPRARSLQRAIDQALVEMRQSGELQALLDRWL